MKGPEIVTKEQKVLMIAVVETEINIQAVTLEGLQIKKLKGQTTLIKRL
jgi:hypothetical protein